MIVLLISSCHSKKNDNTTPFQLSAIKNKDIQNDIACGELNTKKLENPLQSAVYRNDIDAIKLLVKNGYDIHFVSSYGENLLNIGARFSSIEMNKFLIDQGVDMNVSDEMGRSPVTLACRYRSIEFLTLFLDNGAALKKLEINPIK
jgi:ankyrin repeat protein